MEGLPTKPQKTRVISVIDGSNLHVCLKERSQPTRLHYTSRRPEQGTEGHGTEARSPGLEKGAPLDAGH